MQLYNQIQEAIDYIHSFVAFDAKVGIILGTGLGSLTDDLLIAYELDYADIPHFPVSTVKSHKGKLIFGYLEGQQPRPRQLTLLRMANARLRGFQITARPEKFQSMTRIWQVLRNMFSDCASRNLNSQLVGAPQGGAYSIRGNRSVSDSLQRMSVLPCSTYREIYHQRGLTSHSTGLFTAGRVWPRVKRKAKPGQP